MNDDTPIADETTRAALYERARAIDLPGRSGMSKAVLAAALARHDRATARDERSGSTGAAEATARPARPDLAAAPAPRRLTGHDRRLHVRRTLLEGEGLQDPADGTGPALSRLADSPLAFFRGTSRLFEGDRTGDDADMPVVAASGSVPLLDAGNELDAAPFTRDLERAATAFLMAAEELGGASENRAYKIARRFLRSYLDAMRQLADGGDAPQASKRKPGRRGDAVELETLDLKGWKRHAARCGRALAREHVGADASQARDADAASRIVAASGRPRLFVDDRLHIAHETRARVRRDYELFVRDHELGAFERGESAPG